MNIHCVTVHDISREFTQFWGWGHHPQDPTKTQKPKAERGQKHTPPVRPQHYLLKSTKATTTAATGKKQQQQEPKICHDATAPTKRSPLQPTKSQRISNLVHNDLRQKYESLRYTHIKVTGSKGYFDRDINGGRDSMYTADNICKMVEFVLDNIIVQSGEYLFLQVMEFRWERTVLHYLLTFLYSYENEFLDNMIRSGWKDLPVHLIYAIDTLMI